MAAMRSVAVSQMAAATPVASRGTVILRPVNTDILQTIFSIGLGQQQSSLPALTAVPNRIDILYPATDGNAYFLPQAMIAQRKDNPNAPDVFIDVKGGVYTLMITVNLIRHSSLAANAISLPVDNFTVTLQPSAPGAPIPLNQVQILPLDPTPGLVHRLFAQQDVDLNTILAILQSDANAWLEVRADVSYRLQQKTPPPPAPQQPHPPPVVFHPVSPVLGVIGKHPLETARAATPNPVLAVTHSPVLTAVNIGIDQGFIWQPPPPPPSDLQKANVSLSAADKTGVKACFPPTNPANRSIYAKVDPSFGANPDAVWTSIEQFGYVKESGIPNQYYILPDSFGLAFDSNQGLPAMSLILRKQEGAAGAPATYIIRAKFVLAPWVDAERLNNLRGWFRQGQGVAYADFVLGGYDGATFIPTDFFDSLGVTVVSGSQNNGGTASGTTSSPAKNLQIDGAGSFELVLDCTQEFYTLMTSELVQPAGSNKPADGLELGKVNFTLKTQDSPAFAIPKSIQLRLDSTATHPLIVGTSPDAAAPVQDPAAPKGPLSFTVSNPSEVEVTVDKLLATLLLQDEHMPYPCLAEPTKPLQSTVSPALDLQPGAKDFVISLAPPSAGLPAWSAIAVDFENVNLKLDPRAVLDKIHQLATSTDVTSTVRIWSYLLQHPDQIPSTLTGLIGIHVQIERGTAPAVDVRLTPANTQQTVQLAFTVADLVAGMSPDAPTIQYRCANMFAASESAWSTWQTNTGSDVMVFPAGV